MVRRRHFPRGPKAWQWSPQSSVPGHCGCAVPATSSTSAAVASRRSAPLVFPAVAARHPSRSLAIPAHRALTHALRALPTARQRAVRARHQNPASSPGASQLPQLADGLAPAAAGPRSPSSFQVLCCRPPHHLTSPSVASPRMRLLIQSFRREQATAAGDTKTHKAARERPKGGTAPANCVAAMPTPSSC